MSLLDDIKTGKPDSTIFAPHGQGFLKLKYDEEGMIGEISFVLKKDGNSKGMHLYFDWLNEMHAFKTPSGLSGVQWIDGRVMAGTVWDDDGPSDPGREIGLEEWVEECVGKMVE